MTRAILQFPWFGVLASVVFTLLLVLVDGPGITTYVDGSLLVWLHDHEHRLLLFVLVVFVLILD